MWIHYSNTLWDRIIRGSPGGRSDVVSHRTTENKMSQQGFAGFSELKR
ncbi:hypothetical protein PCH70_07090 [Pseudomonas cichorii JBC1]|nr:hypothetical protein PCH70_07090 [Pseudomonas cichorii JBC1]